MTEKPSGMEMMLNSLLKAAGFDPKLIVQNVENFAQQFQGALAQLQARLDMIDARLERLEIALEVASLKEDNEAAIPVRLNGQQQ